VEYDDGDMEMEDLGPGGTPWEPLPGPDDPPLEDVSSMASPQKIPLNLCTACTHCRASPPLPPTS